MSKLTSRQQEIFDFLRRHLEANGAPPTRVEIARKFNFASPNAAESHLRALAKKGVIVLESGAARGIRLMENLQRGLPLIGRVAAGSPILAQEHITAHYDFAPEMFSPRADYLLQVRGLSMINAGILEGDLLAVHATREARDGQIVIARVEEEVTVKRLHRTPTEKIELIAENPDYAPIVIDLQTTSFAIEGIAVGVIRTTI